MESGTPPSAPCARSGSRLEGGRGIRCRKPVFDRRREEPWHFMREMAKISAP